MQTLSPGLQSTARTKIAWRPNKGPQAKLVHCPLDEIFYGGARGGGKTDGMLGKHAIKAAKYGSGVVGVFFRRTREDLKEAVERSQEMYGPIGAKYSKQEKQWRFPNGARLKFEYLDRDEDANNYQGHNYTDLYFEEIQHWPDPKPVNKLRATLRSAKGIPCQFHATGNPGGSGHQWVKARYIDPAPSGWQVLWEDFENPFTGAVERKNRIYIPSKLTDNPFLDGSYVAALQQAGSEQLVRAWLAGDWSVIEGAFFDCWADAKHVLRPFTIPEDWARFRSMDWGSAKPFSVGWWAIVTDDYKHVDGLILPRGALVRYREWYGVKYEGAKIVPNTGLKLTAEQVADGIIEREQGEAMLYGTIDPAAFAEDGGPSIAERIQMRKHPTLPGSVLLQPADNKRVAAKGALGGWDMMRHRFAGEEGRSMIYCFSTCTDSIRTIPVLQHDATRAEDIDTNSEDHAADDWRYACTSRPWIPTGPEPRDDALDDYRTAHGDDTADEWRVV